MKLYCCLCGRPMLQPLVYIGTQPVGEACARRAKLPELAKKKTGLVIFAARSKQPRQPVPTTMDMFAEVPA